MTIYQEIQDAVSTGFPALFGSDLPAAPLTINETPKEFTGDLTLVVFPLLKATKKNPEESARIIGEYLVNNMASVTDFNVIKGFLNLTISDAYWLNYLQAPEQHHTISPKPEKVLIEYSSPNTNKPLHLGHIRNNVLGYALAGIYQANG
ncbi:MAG: arginine--tRNA ligase, partial [Chitinophagales bacterium]|nr:arginine--tRNA ligase [Chitinophagales bacterium]